MVILIIIHDAFHQVVDERVAKNLDYFNLKTILNFHLFEYAKHFEITNLKYLKGYYSDNFQSPLIENLK